MRGSIRRRYVCLYIKPQSSLVQLRRDLRRLLLGEERLVHVAAVLEADVRVVGGAGHGHERCKFRVRQ